MRQASPDARSALDATRNTQNGFTLIEVMVVVGIMAIILAAGIPSLYKIAQKEGMRKATADVVEVLSHARAQAILQGAPMDVVFHPLDGRLAIGGGGGSSEGGEAVLAGAKSSRSSAQLSEDIMIEMLDINLLEYKDSEWARVRFYPNGMSDELTLILRSDRNEWKKVTLEVTTGLATVGDVLR